MSTHTNRSRRQFIGHIGLLAGTATAISVPPVRAADESKKAITTDEVVAAVKAWCDGLVQIGKIKTDGGDYKEFARKLIDDTYDYKNGNVFFRPTLAISPRAFRKTKEGALSYFVGGNKDFPEDGGFALKPWVKVWADDDKLENGIQIHGDIAITMGNLYLQPKDGEQIMVDKTFVFKRCPDGKLRLIVHKSALPNPSK